MKIAIHSVFILKENIYFLEEWIDYHMNLGFNKFYLYDNSKVQKTGGCHNNRRQFIPNEVNKYRVNYDKIVKMTNIEMEDYVKKLCNKYKCVDIIEWSPKDKQGIILHEQSKAHSHCLQRLKRDEIDWCANIDMDEYIVMKDYDNIADYINTLPENICNLRLSQIRFDTRFNNLDKCIIEINKAEEKDLHLQHSNKNIYRVKDTDKISVHFWNGVETIYSDKSYKPPLNVLWFNHYKKNITKDTPHRIIDNIHPTIKKKVLENKKNYIPLNK
jgi:hypothetical protein